MRTRGQEKFKSPSKALISMSALFDPAYRGHGNSWTISRPFRFRIRRRQPEYEMLNGGVDLFHVPRIKRSSRCRINANKGFTLIETLVAISILSISLVVILQLFSGGLKSSRLSDEYTRGIFHAMEKMEEILLADEITDGVFEGEFEDGFRWTAEIIHLESEEPEEEKIKGTFDTFRIKVDIGWKMGSNEKHYEISTIKVTEKIKITDGTDADRRLSENINFFQNRDIRKNYRALKLTSKSRKLAYRRG